EFHRHLASGIFRRKRAEGVDTLKSPDCRVIERRHSAGLFNLHVSRLARASDIKYQVDAIGFVNIGIDFVLEPVLRNFVPHDLGIPGISAAEVAAAPLKSKTALRAIRAERPVRPADRATLAIRNLVGFRFRLGLWFRLAGADPWLGFGRRWLVGDRYCIRFVLL